MANPSNAYIIANVLQDAADLRDRGVLSAAAYDAIAAPLQPHAALAAPYLAAPGGYPAPPGADAASVSASTPAAPALVPSSPAPAAVAATTPWRPAAEPSPAAAPPSPPADDGAPPSVAALTARLGGLNTSRTPLGLSGAGVVRAPSGVPKRTPPPAPAPAAQEKGERAKALWDYKPSDVDELSFAKGDLIAVSERTTDDWWKGHLVGAKGSNAENRLFPANYVELVKTPAPPARRTLSEKEKDTAPPSYGAVAYPSTSSTYGAAPPSAAGYRSYGAPPPASYGAYPPGQDGYAPAQPTAFVAPSAAGLEPESEDKRKARKEKVSKALDSNVGRAAVGGAAFGAAAGIVGGIL